MFLLEKICSWTALYISKLCRPELCR